MKNEDLTAWNQIKAKGEAPLLDPKLHNHYSYVFGGGKMLNQYAFYEKIFLGLAVVFITAWAHPERSEFSLEKRSTSFVKRVKHAKELMGSHYEGSIVQSTEDMVEINQIVAEITKESLAPDWKNKAKKIARAIMRESRKYHFDPVLLLAVIQNESSFRPDMVGSFGEIGLMQIKPDTAEWLAQKANLKWKGKESLFDPVVNIRYGAAYLNMLRDQFDADGRLYLAAYNMGPRNVYRALGKNIRPKFYPYRVMRWYLHFYKGAAETLTQVQSANKGDFESV